MKKIIEAKSFNKDTGELLELNSKPIEVNVPREYDMAIAFIHSFIHPIQSRDNFIITFETHNFIEYSEGDLF